MPSSGLSSLLLQATLQVAEFASTGIIFPVVEHDAIRCNRKPTLTQVHAYAVVVLDRNFRCVKRNGQIKLVISFEDKRVLRRIFLEQLNQSRKLDDFGNRPSIGFLRTERYSINTHFGVEPLVQPHRQVLLGWNLVFYMSIGVD